MDDLQKWLLRFRELDRELIKWKSNLPLQWQEARVRNLEPRMDPNLTLAHLIHNTSMILLHQFIAYPTAQWKATVVKLPQISSAGICLSAATENSTITQKYLMYNTGIADPQFSFCLFVSGRALLAQSAFYNLELVPEFHRIVKSLDDLSRRSEGLYPSSGPDNLAAQFSRSLLYAQTQATSKSDSVDIRKFVDSVDADSEGTTNSGDMASLGSAADPTFRDHANFSNNTSGNGTVGSSCINRHNDLNNCSERSGFHNASSLHDNISQNSDPTSMMMYDMIQEQFSLASPPLPLAFQTDVSISQSFIDTPNSLPASASVSSCNLPAFDRNAEQMRQISNLFADPNIFEMNRVFTYRGSE